MSSYFIYVVEANVCLLLFLASYLLVLRNDTDFSVKRIILLSGVLVSLILPAFQYNLSSSTFGPSISNTITTIWLPEVIIGNSTQDATTASVFTLWNVVAGAYAVGIVIFLVAFIIQLIKLARTISMSTVYQVQNLRISESSTHASSFSFFNFVHIGNSHLLSADEKTQIIMHESVHASRLHSFDILLLNIVRIFFWFNPVIGTYKKILIELHEFEADARSVQNHAVSDYCNLLAKVALMSADLRLANYFTNSLTLKRIEMIRKIKMKISGWKILATSTIVPILIFVIACQDQVLNEATELAKSSTSALDVPLDVQKQYEKLKAENPTSNLLLLEVDENGKAKLQELEQRLKSIDESRITSVNVIKGKAEGSTPARNFLIVAYNEQVAQVSERSMENDVFTIVEESAAPVGGIEKLYQFIGENLEYPTDARTNNIQGTVFVEFIVEKDGAITGANVAKSVDPLLDKAAVAMVMKFPKWLPGKQSGKVVRQKMVLPVNFKLS